MQIEEHLKKIHFGMGLNERELTDLARVAVPRSVKRGEILFLEGDRANGFFLLLSGQVRIFKSSPDGKEYTIHIINPGHIFAEVAAFENSPYPANGAALEDSEIAFFPKEAFFDLIRSSPQISLKIISSLSSFLRDYNRQVENLSLKEVPARIASYLITEAGKSGRDRVKLKSSKTEWARTLGTISETLSRALRKMSDEGIIAVDGREIVILKPERLRNIADGEKI